MALSVAVEGLPGCGKTTVIGMLVASLRDSGFTAEVADIETTGFAPQLRPIAGGYPLGHPARILLFWSLRLQQYEAIQSMLNRVDIVFADRFWGSTLAFDVYGNNVPREFVDWVGRYIKQGPDITLFFDAPLEIVQQRKRASTMNDPDFAQRVVQGYQELAAAYSWTRVDATAEPEQVLEYCLQIILPKLLRVQ